MELPLGPDYPFDIEARMLRQFGVSGPMVDIGGNTGFYSAALEDKVGSSSLRIFEPIPEMADYLRVRFPHARTHPIALSDHQGRETLRIPEIRGRSYLSRATLNSHSEHGQSGFRSVDVVVDTLDHVFPSLGLSEVNLLKIDVEGHELAVLKGARETLLRYKPLILIEVEGRHHSYPISTVFDYIEALGYKGYFIDPFPRFELRPVSDHDQERDQSEAAHQAHKFQRYLNNFLFVDEAAEGDFVARMTRLLESERARCTVHPVSQ